MKFLSSISREINVKFFLSWILWNVIFKSTSSYFSLYYYYIFFFNELFTVLFMSVLSRCFHTRLIFIYFYLLFPFIT